MSRIVIIDDEPAVRAFVRKRLESAGHEVYEAEDGERGLRLCKEVRPDLVYTDLLMPGMDGFTTMAYLRKSYPAMPIVAVSGSTDELTIAHCYRTGATHFLPKPVDSFELVEVAESLAGVLDDVCAATA